MGTSTTAQVCAPACETRVLNPRLIGCPQHANPPHYMRVRFVFFNRKQRGYMLTEREKN
jgi:hypothetical protein